LIGLRNGSIVEVKSVTENEQSEPTVITQTHFDGEAWGIALFDDCVVTSREDNRVMMFNWKTR